MRKQIVTRKQIAAAIRRCGPNYSSIARSLKISRQAIAKRIEADEQLKSRFDDKREQLLDVAEDQLGRAVRKGNSWAIRFILATIGRSRGYAKSLELSGSVDGGSQVILHLPHDGRDVCEDTDQIKYTREPLHPDSDNGDITTCDNANGYGGHRDKPNATNLDNPRETK